LLRIGARGIDYRLREEKRKQRRRLYGRTKPGTLLKHPIPLKTDHGDVDVPGFSEIDLVSHSGDSAAGDFCSSLNLTDIHAGWTETQAVLGKSPQAVTEALETIRPARPFRLRGVDSDNGSVLINDHPYRYCQAQGIQFTRGRPYKKDDNAHIEQKNWTQVRRLLGYVRDDSTEAKEAINSLYRNELRWFQSLFLPSVKLARKERVGPRLRRHYQAPQTPLQRLVGSGATDAVKLAELQQRRERLDPFQLSASIEAPAEEDLRAQPGGPLAFDEACFRRARLAGCRCRGRARHSGRAPPAAAWRTLEFGFEEKGEPQRCGNDAPGKAWKTQKTPKRVSHAFLRAWKSGKSKNAGFPHSHRAGGYG
jgi:hypothetical protein